MVLCVKVKPHLVQVVAATRSRVAARAPLAKALPLLLAPCLSLRVRNLQKKSIRAIRERNEGLLGIAVEPERVQ